MYSERLFDMSARGMYITMHRQAVYIQTSSPSGYILYHFMGSWRYVLRLGFHVCTFFSYIHQLILLLHTHQFTPPSYTHMFTARVGELAALLLSLPGQLTFIYYLWTGRQMKMTFLYLIVFITPNALLPQFSSSTASTLLGTTGVLSFCLILVGDYANIKIVWTTN